MKYRDYVMQNLESARKSEKKSDPKLSIVLFVIGFLLLLNAFLLFVKKFGIVLRFIGPEVSAVLSVIVGLFCIVMGVVFIVSTLKNRKADVTDQRMEQYLKAARALGTEEEVFGKLEMLEPLTLGDAELRFNEELIAVTSSGTVKNNFIYPLFALTEVNPFASGTLYYLSIHAKTDGKEQKYLISCTEDDAIKTAKAILSYRPELAAKAKKEK